MAEEITSQLAKLEDSSKPMIARQEGYQSLIQHITNFSETIKTSSLPPYITSLLSSNLGIVGTRPLLASAVQCISGLSNSPDAQISLCNFALDALRDQGTSTYEESETSLRQILAAAYQTNEEFILAAKTLEAIDLDSTSTSRKVTDEQKVDHWITICRLYIEEDDMLSAETFLNKAKTLRYKISSNAELLLKFSLSQARILDSKRDFLDASQAYYAVSTSPVLDEGDRTTSLTQAIVTSVLAPAGPARSRHLGRLYKDERCATLESYPILSKMYLDRLVDPTEISSFSATLAPHQLARTSDGSTVLAKAMIEHNVLAASKLYANLDFSTLGQILGLDGGADAAEAVVARMIEQKRVEGYIDQIEGYVFFADQGPMREWDGNVARLVEDVERVASLAVAA